MMDKSEIYMLSIKLIELWNSLCYSKHLRERIACANKSAQSVIAVGTTYKFLYAYPMREGETRTVTTLWFDFSNNNYYIRRNIIKKRLLLICINNLFHNDSFSLF